jgi:hypothetical protein
MSIYVPIILALNKKCAYCNLPLGAGYYATYDGKHYHIQCYAKLLKEKNIENGTKTIGKCVPKKIGGA